MNLSLGVREEEGVREACGFVMLSRYIHFGVNPFAISWPIVLSR